MIYTDLEFEINPNINCPDKIGFLMRNKIYGLPDSAVCVGGYQKRGNVFEVCLDTLPDDECDTDSWLVGTVSTIEEAKALLWEYRYNAISGEL